MELHISYPHTPLSDIYPDPGSHPFSGYSHSILRVHTSVLFLVTSLNLSLNITHRMTSYLSANNGLQESVKTSFRRILVSRDDLCLYSFLLGLEGGRKRGKGGEGVNQKDER